MRDESGASAAIVAVGLFATLGMVALAVDLGMMLGAKTESQRVADSGALAGAASLITDPDDENRARSWALEYTAQNTVHGTVADVRPVDVEVFLGDGRVRVSVRNDEARGNPVQTLFGRTMGIDHMDVATVAAAEVASARAGICPLPFAIPDRWLDNPSTSDEQFDENEDLYEPFNESGSQCAAWPCVSPPNFTGFHGDDISYNLGDVIEIRQLSAGSPPPLVGDGSLESYNANPCYSHPYWSCWYLPDGSNGATVGDWVDGCADPDNAVALEVGAWIQEETGSFQFQVITAFMGLVDNFGGDGWSWNAIDQCIEDGNGCMDPSSEAFAERHRAMPIIDPTSADGSGDAQIARWECAFIEKVASEYWIPGQEGVSPTPNGYGPQSQWNVYARLSRCGDGGKPGPATGQTLKTLRLVE